MNYQVTKNFRLNSIKYTKNKFYEFSEEDAKKLLEDKYIISSENNITGKIQDDNIIIVENRHLKVANIHLKNVIADLKKENKSIKKENGNLKKELNSNPLKSEG